MKKQWILFILITCSFFCASQKKEIIAKSTIKLEGKNTNIRDLMEIDGYYIRPDYPQYGNIMFFEDGTWVYFSFKRGLSENDKKENLIKSVECWSENNQIRWGSYWGVYRIRNDTIRVHRYDKGSFWKGWSLSEERYKIINKKTIKRIYFRGILKADDSYYEFNSPWIYDADLYFTPADSLPSSDNWLKEKKWIWRHERDWKAYMEKIKQEKKKRK